VADNPQQTIRELRDLVVAYARQETVDPLRSLGKYAGFGIGGALILGLGVVFLEIGVLRVLQEQTGVHLTGNWSWVPYAVVVVASLVTAALIWTIASRTSRRRRAS
jgi:Putative Actinobacterial Holin-X, holin superfamily III